ncbi:hypothetical protein DFP72DRAFT_917245 [Ephemerocybe angulata]|uniref:Uncharacterized protein n=1 Tax=Ephemerocybe angulata TaxID=980116 RepID=A0A8H6LZ27_9AGAR|nr:hypothetical protein DFP72DRAFT_917245 [Tulosesus angulatus]
MPTLEHRSQAGTNDDYAAAVATVQDGLYAFYDDSRSDTFYFPGSWGVNRDSKWAKGIETTYDAHDGEGHFEVIAYGTPLSIVGSVPQSSENRTFLVSIDGGDQFEGTFLLPSTIPYGTWYTLDLPSSPAGARVSRVTFIGVPRGTGVDFALAGVHEKHEVTKDTVFVDDSASSVSYTGEWVHDPDMATALNGTIHTSGNPGDTMSVKFLGTSISLYGTFTPSSASAPLSVSYTIDAGTPEVVSYASPSTSLPSTNTELYHFADLPPALHTLTVTIVSSNSSVTSTNATASLILDYLTYTPAFASIDWLRHNRGLAGLLGGNKPRQAMSPGALAGTIVGLLCAVLALIGLVCCRGKRACLRRRVRGWGKESKGKGNRGVGTEKSTDRLDSSRNPHFAFKHPAATYSKTSFSSVSVDEKDVEGELEEPPRSPSPICLNVVVQGSRSRSLGVTGEEDRSGEITPFDTTNNFSPKASMKPTSTTKPLEERITPFPTIYIPSTSSEKAALATRDLETRITPFPSSLSPSPSNPSEKSTQAPNKSMIDPFPPSAGPSLSTSSTKARLTEHTITPFPTSATPSSTSSKAANAYASTSSKAVPPPTLYRQRSTSSGRARTLSRPQRRSRESLQAELDALVLETEHTVASSGTAEDGDADTRDRERVRRMAELVREIGRLARGLEKGGGADRGGGDREALPPYEVGVAL